MRKEINYMKMAVMNTEGEEQEACIRILNELERKRKVRRILNKIRIAMLKAITCIAGFIFLLGVCLLDGENIIIPVAVTFASGLWLALMAHINC